MKIRERITLTFFLIVIFILSIASAAIYYFSASYRKDDFLRRLKNRGSNTVNILVEYSEVPPDLLRRMEKDNPASLPNQFMLVFDARDRELYRSDSIRFIPVDGSLLARIQQAKEVYFGYGDFEVVGFVAYEQGVEYRVIAAAVDLYGFDALENLRNILIAVFAVSVIVVSAAGWFYSGRIIAPVARIVKEVDAITEESLNRRLNEGDGSDELEKLAQTFNRMLERIEGAFFSQKNFIANASHELRTPIALIVAEIEATLINADKSDPHVAVLISLLESARRLNALANQLLLLAHTSAEMPDKGFRDVRVDEVLWEAKSDVETLHPEYHIDIHFDSLLNDKTLVVRGDEQLIKVVFTNLIDNGCKYSFEKTVDVTLHGTATTVTVNFVNKGVAIPAADLSRIFVPFFRGGNVSKTKGYGIGLPLAKRIMIFHGGSIHVESVADGTTTLRVTFPGTLQAG